MRALRHLSRRSFACKLFENSVEAVDDIRTGSKVAVGGYGSCGVPENSLRALHHLGAYNLTVYSSTAGIPGWGLDPLLKAMQVKRLVTCYSGGNPSFQKMYLNGQVELVMIPEGSMAARMYAGGAGIPGIYTKTGVGTYIEEGHFPIKYRLGGKGVEIYSSGKEKRIFNGREHLLEQAILTDYSLVKAWKGDTRGNLVFRRTAANFNTVMAMCARVCIAEVEELVPEGQIDPDDVHVPSVYVHRLYKGEYFEKPIEQLTTRTAQGVLSNDNLKNKEEKLRIAKRAVKELKDGMSVHLGIGIPSLIADLVDPSLKIMVHSDSGALGVGQYPQKGQQDSDIINSGRETVTLVPGASCFNSNDGMDMLRGGHLDLNIIGAFQVSSRGDVANWMIPGKYTAGIGASMDLLAGEKTNCVVTMLHTVSGNPKIVKDCTLPVTGKRCVDLLITELVKHTQGVFDFTREDTLTLTEIAPDVRLSDIKEATGCGFHVASDLKTMS